MLLPGRHNRAGTVFAARAVEVSLERAAELGQARRSRYGHSQVCSTSSLRDARVELGDLELGQLNSGSTAAAPGGEQPTDLGGRVNPASRQRPIGATLSAPAS